MLQGRQLGWGCLKCGLPMDGAMTNLCGPCAVALSNTRDISTLKYIVVGAIGSWLPLNAQSLYWKAGHPDKIGHNELYHQPLIPGILPVHQVFWSVN
jgi:hypothetical protein